jgi:hypothetical protein
MKFMLLMCVDESADRRPEDHPEVAKMLADWISEMRGRGVLRDGDRLQPVSQATSVRIRDGELLLADGPFAETKEQIGGYDVIECADLAEAVEIASKHPVAVLGTVEVRPFLPDWSVS